MDEVTIDGRARLVREGILDVGYIDLDDESTYQPLNDLAEDLTTAVAMSLGDADGKEDTYIDTIQINDLEELISRIKELNRDLPTQEEGTVLAVSAIAHASGVYGRQRLEVFGHLVVAVVGNNEGDSEEEDPPSRYAAEGEDEEEEPE